MNCIPLILIAASTLSAGVTVDIETLDGRTLQGELRQLSADEIGRAVAAFATLGRWKVRLTGGEPTLRRDFDAVARTVAAVPGIRRVAMTTNGWNLARHIDEWAAAGLTNLNVSVDSLELAGEGAFALKPSALVPGLGRRAVA